MTQFTDKWSCEEKTKQEYEGKIEAWMTQFSPKDIDVLSKLVTNFSFYSNTLVREKVVELYEKIQQLGIDIEQKTVFAQVEKPHEVGYSDGFFFTFWSRNDLYDNARKNLEQLLENGERFDTIVIVDDVSGTGNTLKNVINTIVEICSLSELPRLIVATMEMTGDAINTLHDYAVEKSIAIEMVFLYKSQKAFEADVIFSKAECESKKNEYVQICMNKRITKESIVLGYGSSELLIAFEDTTPNNTLGLFWCAEEGYVPLFKRHKRGKTNLGAIREKNKDRVKQNRKHILKQSEEAMNKLYLATYLVGKGDGVSYSEVKADLGMTNDQIDRLLNELFKEGFIILSQGAFWATEKMKRYVRMKQIKPLEEEIKEKPFNAKDTNYYPGKFEAVFSGYNNV